LHDVQRRLVYVNKKKSIPAADDPRIFEKEVY
jgi:hypothetical protein